jgi:sugar phosphate permease
MALALLVAGSAVAYIDRATLTVANPLIRRDMGLSVADMGLLLSLPWVTIGSSGIEADLTDFVAKCRPSDKAQTRFDKPSLQS